MATTNAPLPLSNMSQGAGTVIFPSDLLSYTSTPSNITGTSTAVASGQTQYSNGQGGYYSSFQLVPANSVFSAVLSSGTTTVTSGTAGSSYIYLPLPSKIQDVQLAAWEDNSWTYIPGLSAIAAGINAIGRLGGSADQAVDPMLFMMWKQTLFREFTLQWILAPNSAAESQTLLQILYAFKTAVLPSTGTVPGLLTYPYLVQVKLNPNAFLFDFLPCCIVSCEVDFTGTGHGPAFFNDGSPTIVSFTLHLKEVKIQTRSQVAPRGGSLTSGMAT